jgi:hypothetical protein
MIEGTVRHPMSGTPQGGIISPLLSNIFLTAIDERYRRWSPTPREPLRNSSARRIRDYNGGKPTFYIVRYADDFVVLVTGGRQAAEAEKDALAEYLRRELRLELPPEKTLVTDLREGFDFLGYRIVQAQAWSGRMVCMVRIPPGKLQRMRDTIKARTKRDSLTLPLSELIDDLNPLITGWRNYYRHAMMACREFSTLDWWLWWRIYRWMRAKHPKSHARYMLARYLRAGNKDGRRWADGGARLRKFAEGGTMPYPFRGTNITNGWDELEVPDIDRPRDFWQMMNGLFTALQPPAT